MSRAAQLRAQEAAGRARAVLAENPGGEPVRQRQGECGAMRLGVDLLRGPREVGGREYGPNSGIREEPDGAGRVVEGGRRPVAAAGDVHGVRKGGGRAGPDGVSEQHSRAPGDDCV